MKIKTTRLERMRELFLQMPYISLSELAALFPEVSEMTLRRDIDALEAEGAVIRVRGGARSMKFITATYEDRYEARLSLDSGAKGRIAAAAIRLFDTGMSIFIDSGTTTLRIADYLPNDRFLITTSSPDLARELHRTPLAVINIVGGMYNRENHTLSGQGAIKFISDMTFDLAIMAPSGYTKEGGFSSGNYSECEFKKKVIERSRHVAMLITSSKWGLKQPYTFASPDDISTIITDAELPHPFAQDFDISKTSVIIA